MSKKRLRTDKKKIEQPCVAQQPRTQVLTSAQLSRSIIAFLSFTERCKFVVTLFKHWNTACDFATFLQHIILECDWTALSVDKGKSSYSRKLRQIAAQGVTKTLSFKPPLRENANRCIEPPECVFDEDFPVFTRLERIEITCEITSVLVNKMWALFSKQSNQLPSLRRMVFTSDCTFAIGLGYEDLLWTFKLAAGVEYPDGSELADDGPHKCCSRMRIGKCYICQKTEPFQYGSSPHHLLTCRNENNPRPKISCRRCGKYACDACAATTQAPVRVPHEIDIKFTHCGRCDEWQCRTCLETPYVLCYHCDTRICGDCRWTCTTCDRSLCGTCFRITDQCKMCAKSKLFLGELRQLQSILYSQHIDITCTFQGTLAAMSQDKAMPEATFVNAVFKAFNQVLDSQLAKRLTWTATVSKQEDTGPCIFWNQCHVYGADL
jgi:hypothetical protein